MKLLIRSLCILMAAGSLWACSKKQQTIAVLDICDNNKAAGNIIVYALHFPKGSADQDLDDTPYPNEHYGIAITVPADAKDLPMADFEKLSGVAVKSVDNTTFLTDETYMCNQSSNIKEWFGCRLSVDAVNKNNSLILTLKTSDNKLYTTGPITMSNPESAGDTLIEATLQASTEGDAETFTLTSNESTMCPGDKKTEGTNSDTKKNCAYLDTAGNCVEVTPKEQLCASGNYILLGGKDCGTTCGANQIIKNGKCVCQNGAVMDDKGTGCVADPNVNPLPPPGSSSTGGGGSCSLIRMK